jgi:hypothetical protein
MCGHRFAVCTLLLAGFAAEHGTLLCTDLTALLMAQSYREQYDLYGADEFGSVTGEQEMMAEIYARGPISCSLNSDVPAFDQYR